MWRGGASAGMSALCFFFNDTATTEIYTLSLHDALPIFLGHALRALAHRLAGGRLGDRRRDRKSTRLNSSHSQISYAGFCLKKKKTHTTPESPQRRGGRWSEATDGDQHP